MITRLILLLLCSTLLAACGNSPGEDSGGHSSAAAANYERGPQNGRLLRDGDFAVEVTIFETSVPPQFRLYAYRDGKPVPAAEVEAAIELFRLGGKRDRHTFSPETDALVGSATVYEPHSFDVIVTATEAGRQHRWEYASHEGRTAIPTAVAQSAGVRTEAAGPATIRTRIPLIGSVIIDENRLARVRARFPGPVREVNVGPGDTVKRGKVLAVVEGNESMRGYPVTAPMDGVVTARNTNVGDVAGDAPLFELADLSHVWVDLHAFGNDMRQLKPGQPVTITSTVDEQTAEATLERILPVAAAGSQSAIARVRLPNPEGFWRPGLAVGAEVTVAEHQVPLAVNVAGLQRYRDFTVVFAQFGDTYEVRMLDLGKRDAQYAEVLGGIDPGTPYVTEQSFLIRADVEKSGASHDH